MKKARKQSQTGAMEPVQNWVRKSLISPKKVGAVKSAIYLIEAQKVGAQMRTLAH